MGLIVNVYRSSGSDCTNGGISSKHQTLCVVNAEGPFEPTENCPAVMLDNHYPGIVRIVPAVQGALGHWFVNKTKWFMAGGNYAATSDSRFSYAIEALTDARFYGAVSIHDRVEG